MASRGINLHPQGHHPAELSTTAFDIIIIGAGPVANFAEQRLAASGLSVAVIAAELYGGDCHYFACVPSKALLRPLEALTAAKSVGGAHEAVTDAKLDVNATFARRDKIVSSWNDNEVIAAQSEVWKTTVIRGFGRVAGVKKVTVQPYGEQKLFELIANHAVIVSTGSTHVTPPIPGIEQLTEGKELWINRDATASNLIPEHLIILGAGAVGTEMATFYSGAGSKVTLISTSSHILPKVESEAAALVHKSLSNNGVSIKLSTAVSKITKHEGSVSVTLSDGSTIQGSVILNAIGRKPRTFDLGLETLGIKGEGLPLLTDPSLSVKGTNCWLYAIGDVNALGPTTHMGIYQARIASNTILANIKQLNPGTSVTPPPHSQITSSKDFTRTFPQVIFTEPSIASVGHTLASARAAGIKVRAADSDFGIPGQMLYADDSPAWARWVIEEGTERLVGATYCALEASEFVNAASVAVVGGLTLGELVHVVPPFPTRGEIFTYLVNAAGY